MSDIWFTSDQHFNHFHVIRYSNRPFSSLEEMNDALIANHNSVVKPGDRVYHLGDFAFKSPELFAPKLNGQNYLIKGNHDDRKHSEKSGFIWVKDTFGLKVSKEMYIWLSHYPHRSWNGSAKGSYHLYGHSHGNSPDFGRSCDVGVDCWGYFPVNLDQIVSRLKDNFYVDHHENAHYNSHEDVS